MNGRVRTSRGPVRRRIEVWRARRPSGLAVDCAEQLGVTEERVLRVWERMDELARGAA